MNDLLEDILDEDHKWALSGEKKIPKKEQIRNTPTWSDDKSWISEGYVAHVFVSVCACGETEKHLWGIFHRERSPSGAVKEIKLQGKIQIPGDKAYPVRVIQTPQTDVCIHCMNARGFSEAHAPEWSDPTTHAEVYTHAKQ